MMALQIVAAFLCETDHPEVKGQSNMGDRLILGEVGCCREGEKLTFYGIMLIVAQNKL